MFSRAPIKRYNDEIPETPGPNAYDPKDLKKKKAGVADVKSTRFPKDHKGELPGPGQYNLLSVTTAGKKKGSGGKQPKANFMYSTESVNEVFGTPCAVPCPSAPLTKSIIKAKRSGSNSSSVASEPSFTLAVNWKAKCADLEEKVARLQAELKQAGQIKEKTKDLEKTIENLREELGERRLTLGSKMESLEDIIKDRDELQDKWQKMEDEREANAARIATLSTELELLQQDNKTLEESAEADRERLAAERKSLEDKSNFLHFTQEQLVIELNAKNHQVDTLEQEIDDLKSEVDKLGIALEDEKEKREEITQVYMKENAETLEEFIRLKNEKERLIADKFIIVSQAAKTSNKLQVENEGLIGQNNQLKIRIEDMESKAAELRREIKELKDDVEVGENDKGALKDELARVEKEKSAVELDLGEALREKEALTRQLETLAEEQNSLKSEIERLGEENLAMMELNKSEKSRNAENENVVNELKEQLSENHERCEKLNAEIENSNSLISELRNEVNELEMKANSLEGSLSAARGESANLISENQQLTNCMELLEEKLQTATDECNEAKEKLEQEKAMKKDLNETCLILEQRKDLAEAAKEKLVQKVEEMSRELEASSLKLAEIRQQAEQGEAKFNQEEGQLKEKLSLVEGEVEKARSELETAKAQLEESSAQLEQVSRERSRLLEMNEESSAEISENLNTIKQLQDKEEQLGKQIKMLKESQTKSQESESELLYMKGELDTKDKLIKKLVSNDKENRCVLEAAQKCNEELKATLQGKEAKLLEYREYLDCYDKVMADKKEVETLLGDIMEQLKEKEATFEKAIAEKEDIIAQKAQEVEEYKVKAEKEEEDQSIKEKYESLLAMVGPFKEQLEQYELERQSLVSQNEATTSDLKKLAEQQGQMLGHQNHKQKINHLVQLKKERVDLQRDNARLNAEVAKLKRQINKRGEGEKAVNKENLLHPKTAKANLMKAPVLGEESRRHTMAASPLAARNKRK